MLQAGACDDATLTPRESPCASGSTAQPNGGSTLEPSAAALPHAAAEADACEHAAPTASTPRAPSSSLATPPAEASRAARPSASVAASAPPAMRSQGLLAQAAAPQLALFAEDTGTPSAAANAPSPAASSTAADASTAAAANASCAMAVPSLAATSPAQHTAERASPPGAGAHLLVASPASSQRAAAIVSPSASATPVLLGDAVAATVAALAAPKSVPVRVVPSPGGASSTPRAPSSKTASPAGTPFAAAPPAENVSCEAAPPAQAAQRKTMRLASVAPAGRAKSSSASHAMEGATKAARASGMGEASASAMPQSASKLPSHKRTRSAGATFAPRQAIRFARLEDWSLSPAIGAAPSPAGAVWDGASHLRWPRQSLPQPRSQAQRSRSSTAAAGVLTSMPWAMRHSDADEIDNDDQHVRTSQSVLRAAVQQPLASPGLWHSGAQQLQACVERMRQLASSDPMAQNSNGATASEQAVPHNGAYQRSGQGDGRSASAVDHQAAVAESSPVVERPQALEDLLKVLAAEPPAIDRGAHYASNWRHCHEWIVRSLETNIPS